MCTTIDLLNYCWKYRLFESYVTTDGKEVEVMDQGLFNRNQGSSFFNAKVRINHTLMVGNVQTLEKASDWYARGYDLNPQYGNVILLVCDIIDSDVFDNKGQDVPTIQGIVPEKVNRNIEDITQPTTGQTMCKMFINDYNSALTKHAWLAALQTEFLENELDYLNRFYKEWGKDLEMTFFVSLLRGFGFVANKTAMDLLARNTTMEALERCRDDVFQIEAILFGQAGLLELEPDVQCALPKQYRDKALMEGYFMKLRNEWLYLQKKFRMNNCLSKLCWHPYGTGGLKYPHVYLSMLANWWYMRKMSASGAMNITSAKRLMTIFDTHVTPYWETHYMFGAESKKSMKCLTDDRKAWLIMASFVPFLFFCGRLKNDEEMCDTAFDLMEQTKPFSTPESNGFKKTGLVVKTAGDTVAMVQLQREYCDNHNCLNCQFGLNYVKRHGV